MDALNVVTMGCILYVKTREIIVLMQGRRNVQPTSLKGLHPYVFNGTVIKNRENEQKENNHGSTSKQ